MDELSEALRLAKAPQTAQRARIYASSHDHRGTQPLWAAIVTKAREPKSLVGRFSRLSRAPVRTAAFTHRLTVIYRAAKSE